MSTMRRGCKPTQPGIYGYQDGGGSPVLKVHVYLKDGALWQRIEGELFETSLEEVKLLSKIGKDHLEGKVMEGGSFFTHVGITLLALHRENHLILFFIPHSFIC